MKQASRWLCGWGIAFVTISVPAWVWGFEVVSPKAGAELEVGGTYTVQVRPSPGEELVVVAMPFDDVFTFNPVTGMFEWVEHIRQDIRLGPANWQIHAVDRQERRIKVMHPVVYVLPPTTVVVGIDALVKNRKDAILEIYRTATGELELGSMSAGRIAVGGMYSDGVERGVASHPQTTYTSTNEKVATVTLPSEKTGVYPIVTAVGRGTANIIVRYGSFENILVVKVWECPYETRDEVPSKRGECKR